MLITLTSLADHRLRLPKAGPCRGETLWDPTGPRQDAMGSPKHAARTLIRHSDRRTMRTTQATDLHPRRIPEVSHETKNATRLHTSIRWVMTPAHTQSWPPPPPPPPQKPSACRPTIPRTTTTVAGLVHSHAAVTPGHGGSRQTPRLWSIPPSPRARRQRRRPCLQYQLHHQLLASLRSGDLSRGGFPTGREL